MTRYVVQVPIATLGTGNAREHRMARAERVRGERLAVALVLQAQLPRLRPEQVDHVQLTRIARRRLDSDGAVHALKAVRDETAKQLGGHDGPRGIRFTYGDQELGEPGVRIEIVMKETGR